jgi:hypothetical protein
MNNNTETKEITVYQRMSQVYKLTLNVPLNDEGVKIFYNSLIENLDIHPTVYTEKRCLCDIHTNDAINVLMGCFEYCHEKECDTFILTSILSAFNIFNNLKLISFEFIENDDILDIYKNINDTEYKGDKTPLLNKIYNIDEIEIHLCDSLNKNIVDFFNNMFMFYGYIPNDYMKRRFSIDFEFDEYISFIEMIFSNNKELTKQMGVNLISHLNMFPVVVVQSKPKIRIVTNYFDL